MSERETLERLAALAHTGFEVHLPGLRAAEATRAATQTALARLAEEEARQSSVAVDAGDPVGLARAELAYRAWVARERGRLEARLRVEQALCVERRAAAKAAFGRKEALHALFARTEAATRLAARRGETR